MIGPCSAIYIEPAPASCYIHIIYEPTRRGCNLSLNLLSRENLLSQECKQHDLNLNDVMPWSNVILLVFVAQYSSSADRIAPALNAYINVLTKRMQNKAVYRTSLREWRKERGHTSQRVFLGICMSFSIAKHFEKAKKAKKVGATSPCVLSTPTAR